ncbi:hypothetical protein U3653_07125 [Nocardia sp. CDC186]|uniref:Uncharacterized protein n=1 Tax=Nocardia implantans TaxID=3108168 RepID=A0ABU6AQP2_9NOCA|nr:MULTISPECIES: hypothetical protein [unclassified Nocardia]MBF6190124.1 hypothetical protein [Nocardia beijingensis]MEA3526643.1 hypothetical protein [Nocardia sp. CDC192]MEB3509780.1 hypothetical protein [Nocardia sp. CDC186]
MNTQVVQSQVDTVMTEAQARLLLLGAEALSIQERWLLAWLSARPNRMSIAFEEIAGLGPVGSPEFGAMCVRWRECGLLRLAYSEEHDATLWQATDFAEVVLRLNPVEWVLATTPHAPVELDDVIELGAVA